MTDQALVSVVIPTYNRSDLLQRAIESVRRQTHAHWEICVVDDASPKVYAAAVVARLADPRIRYLRHERNLGVSAARNTGIRAARGVHIALLDDDDQWREDKLEKQLRAIADYGAVLCSAVLRDGTPLRIVRGRDVTLAHLRRGSFFPSSLLARAPVLQSVLFDETLRVGEDWDLFIRIALRYRIGWLSDPLLIYNDAEHARTTNDGRLLSGQELEKRAAFLHKNREFFGEFWARRHLAVELLPYIGSRPDRARCLMYAIKRSGATVVLVVLAQKAWWWVRKRWTRIQRLFHGRDRLLPGARVSP